jgi:hypothetical protein
VPLFLLLLALMGGAPEPLLVFVTVPEPNGGARIDYELTAARGDVERAIDARPGLRRVATRAEADVVVTVLARGVTTSETGDYVFTGYPPPQVGPAAQKWPAIKARVEAGKASRIVIGEYSGSNDWQRCAEQIAKDVDGWASGRRDRLLAARAARVTRP